MKTHPRFRRAAAAARRIPRIKSKAGKRKAIFRCIQEIKAALRV